MTARDSHRGPDLRCFAVDPKNCGWLCPVVLWVREGERGRSYLPRKHVLPESLFSFVKILFPCFADERNFG